MRIDPDNSNTGTESASDPVADALAAMDAGIAGEPMPELKGEAPKVADEPKGDAVNSAEPKTGEEPKAGEQGTPPGEQPKQGEAPKEAPKAEEKKAEPTEPDPVETEIASLGAKGKTAERIRDLSAKVAAAEPMRAELEQMGVTSIEQVQELARSANTGIEMIDLVRKTGASEEEYGFALDWLSMRSRGRSGDVKAAEEAFEVIAEEYATLAKLLGKEVPGVHDPLQGHADLLDEIEKGDLPRARALEIANQRNLRAMAEQGQKTQQQQRTQQEALTQAQDKARTDLNALGDALGKEDAARLSHYHGNGELKKIIDSVKAQHPRNPEMWTAQIELAYRRLPALASAPKPATNTGTPVRAATPMTPAVTPSFKDMDPMEAMELGISGA